METAGSEPRSNNREALRTLGVGARREGECRHDELHRKEALGWSYKKSVGAPANETLKLKVLGKREQVDSTRGRSSSLTSTIPTHIGFGLLRVRVAGTSGA